MDEISEIQALQEKIGALLRARNYLLNQTPSDMVAIADVTERILDLNRRLFALISGPQLPMLSKERKESLEKAIRELDDQIAKSKAASDILASVTTLKNAG